jgi:hypothetical protein
VQRDLRSQRDLLRGGESMLRNNWRWYTDMKDRDPKDGRE